MNGIEFVHNIYINHVSAMCSTFWPRGLWLQLTVAENSLDGSRTEVHSKSILESFFVVLNSINYPLGQKSINMCILRTNTKLSVFNNSIELHSHLATEFTA